jgi:hypothetical protein
MNQLMALYHTTNMQRKAQISQASTTQMIKGQMGIASINTKLK